MRFLGLGGFGALLGVDSFRTSRGFKRGLLGVLRLRLMEVGVRSQALFGIDPGITISPCSKSRGILHERDCRTVS